MRRIVRAVVGQRLNARPDKGEAGGAVEDEALAVNTERGDAPPPHMPPQIAIGPAGPIGARRGERAPVPAREERVDLVGGDHPAAVPCPALEQQQREPAFWASWVAKGASLPTQKRSWPGSGQ